MKTRFLISAFMLGMLCNGCVNHISEEEDEEEPSQKTIVFTTSMSILQSPMRAISDNVSKVVVADYQNGVETQRVEQSSTDANFGKVSLPLKYGTHELLFVGHSSEKSTISYPNIAFEKPTDTFAYNLSLDVNEDTSPTQNITLNRAVGMLKVIANDAIPSDVSSLKISLSTYYPVLNIQTSLADGEPKSVERTFEYKTSHIGVKGSSYSIYTFTPEKGFKSDIVISTIDSKGNIVNCITIEDVSIEKNRQSILSGNIFQLSSDIGLSVNDQWGENIEYPI